MKLRTMAVSKLVEHPRNKGLFKDIAETNPIFWLDFKKSIEEFGVIEPLIVNEVTKEVRSGNQRLKAAVELGLSEVPVLLVDAEDSEEEIRKMIASNVYRRTIDPFAMFQFIGILRKGHHSEPDPTRTQGPGLNLADTRRKVQKSKSFVSAADLFNTLDEEQQETLQEWFYEKWTDEQGKEHARTEGELIAQLTAFEEESLVKDADYKDLLNLQRSDEDRAETLQKMLDTRDEEIEELKDLDVEEEIETRDAQIRRLEGQKRKLVQKLKEAQDAPDLNIFLRDCVKRQKDTNAVLKEIVENKDALNQDLLKDLVKLVGRTVAILKTGTETKGDKPKELE